MKNERSSIPVQSPAEVIRSLRAERGLSQLELSRLAEMSPAQLCKIEQGRNALTASTLRRLADALGAPVSVLLGESVPVAAAPPRERDPGGISGCAHGEGDYVQVLRSPACGVSVPEEIVEFERKVSVEEARLGISGQTALQLVYSYGGDGRAAELLARDVRVSLGIGCQPWVDYDRLFESLGVNVIAVARPMSLQSTAFFNMRRRTLSIALNGSNTPERDAYRLAYELGGAVRFASCGYETVVDEGAEHVFLRAFVAAFLMPEEAVRSAVARLGIKPGGWTMPALVYVKERFGVSAEAFALRLESLGLIVPSLRLKLRDELRAGYAAHPRSMEPHPPKRQTRLDIMEEVSTP